MKCGGALKQFTKAQPGWLSGVLLLGSFPLPTLLLERTWKCGLILIRGTEDKPAGHLPRKALFFNSNKKMMHTTKYSYFFSQMWTLQPACNHEVKCNQ